MGSSGYSAAAGTGAGADAGDEAEAARMGTAVRRTNGRAGIVARTRGVLEKDRAMVRRLRRVLDDMRDGARCGEM